MKRAISVRVNVVVVVVGRLTDAVVRACAPKLLCLGEAALMMRCVESPATIFSHGFVRGRHSSPQTNITPSHRPTSVTCL
jgi:hypothetical protein